jgi:hypothetical protein
MHHIHIVATIRCPLCSPPRFPAVRFISRMDEEVENVRTSAALAAASLGFDDSSGACGFFPSVCPPFGAEILGGAAALALVERGGAFAGVAPSVRPSPRKFSSD